jgi:hypothetical protein
MLVAGVDSLTPVETLRNPAATVSGAHVRVCCRPAVVHGAPWRAWLLGLSLRLQGGPPGRTCRRLGGPPSLPPRLPCRRAPTPVGWPKDRSVGAAGTDSRSPRRSSSAKTWAWIAPLRHCPGRSEPVKVLQS